MANPFSKLIFIFTCWHNLSIWIFQVRFLSKWTPNNLCVSTDCTVIPWTDRANSIISCIVLYIVYCIVYRLLYCISCIVLYYRVLYCISCIVLYIVYCISCIVFWYRVLYCNIVHCIVYRVLYFNIGYCIVISCIVL